MENSIKQPRHIGSRLRPTLETSQGTAVWASYTPNKGSMRKLGRLLGKASALNQLGRVVTTTSPTTILLCSVLAKHGRLSTTHRRENWTIPYSTKLCTPLPL